MARFDTRPVLRADLSSFIAGVGSLLFVLFFGLFFWFHDASLQAITSTDFLMGLLTTLPFVAALLYGGYWLRHSEIPPERYPRIRRWFLGGLAGFLLLNAAMIAVWPADTTYDNIAWALFAAAVGGAVGQGLGVFEARAIDRATEAERTRIKREELKQRNERLEEFANTVSHDLRNPLSVASGRLELLRAEYDEKHIDAIASAHDRMDAIIERTLTLARSGRSIGETEPVEIGPLATVCWDAVTTDGTALEIDGSVTVEADRDRLRHLFENLFRNAVEHGSTSSRPEADDTAEHGPAAPDSRARREGVERDGPDVTVRVGPTEDGFYVEDDGPGIPEADREDVFGSNYSTSEEGIGIGLSIVRQVVEAHGWEISITDGSDGGARFEITVDGSSPE